MAFTKEQIDELKANLAVARKRELPFGLCIGKAPETTVLVNHKTKDPEALGRQAKKDGETAKVAFGMMTVEGKNLNLSCAGDVPTGMARKMRELLKLVGVKVKVRVLDAAGNPLEEDGDDEDAEDGDAAADPLTEEWGVARTSVEEALQEAASLPAETMEPLRTSWAEAGAAAEGGDLAAAIAKGQDVLKAVEAARLGDADRIRWEQALPTMTPLVDEAVASATPVAAKIGAVWSFAQTKAGGNPPDYGAAVKSITMLVKLLEDNRKVMAKAGGGAVPADAGAAEAQAAFAGNGSGAPGPAGAAAPGGGAPAGAAPAAPGGAAPAGAGAPPPAGAAPAAPGDAAAAPADPAAAPGGPPKVDPKATPKEKFDAAEATLKALDALIVQYMGLIPGSAEPQPAAWTTERTRIDGILAPMRPAGAALDAKKIDDAQKALVKLDATVRAKTTEKAEWKKTLDLFKLRLVPLDRHAQAGAVPQVKPKIDAIKAEMAKAVLRADKQDFKGATALLAPLAKRCDEAEALADGFAHYNAILAQRQSAIAALSAPPAVVPTGVKVVDDIKAALDKLLADAQALATAGKYPDAVKKLDAIPPIVDKYRRLEDQRTSYDWWVAQITPALAALAALPAATRAPFQSKIDGWKKDFDNAKIAKTKDYAVSIKKVSFLGDLICSFPPNPATGFAGFTSFIDREVAAGSAYQAALAAFEPQLATFKAHAGKLGIEPFILEMDKDLAQAKSEAVSNKFSTAAAILTRTQAAWPAQTKIADDCKAYDDKRTPVAAAIAALKGNPAAATVLAQAEGLMATAATQALSRDYVGALANVTEAEKRAADAKAAADAQGDLAKLKDGAALDAMAADFEKAMKVFTDMRANVVSKDAGNAFAALIATADAPAQKARDAKAKTPPDYGAARAELDKAIAILEGALPKVMAKGPYDAHLATAKAAAAALVPLNIDDCIKAALTTVNTRITEAEALAKAPGYDFAGAEAKLAEAAVAADGAKANAGLWPTIKADRATTVSAKTAINAAAGVAALMPKRIARIDKIVADLDAKVAAGDFKAAQALGKEGAALLAPNAADITTCQSIILRTQNWYTNHLPGISGPANAAVATEFAKVQARFAEHQAMLAAEQFSAALAMLSEVSWGVQACQRLLAERGTYEPARVAAAAAIKTVADIRNAGVEKELVVIEKQYADAVAEAGKQNFFGAEREMKVITPLCPPLVLKAQAWKLYDDARKLAEPKLLEAEGHPAAASIKPMLTRLRAKYDAAVKQAEGGDPAGAKTAMDEIVPAANDALEAAKNSALFAVGAGVAGAVGPNPIAVTAAKAALAVLSGKPEAPASKVDLDEATKQLAVVDAPGTAPAAADAAFKAATDALTRAEMAQAQARMLGETVKAANAKIAELKAHPQAGYIATETTALTAETDAVLKTAQAGGDPDGATAKLETTMQGIAAAKAMADAQVKYIALRATPEVEPRLEVLERHAHRYAIAANIDTIRAKLDKAAQCSVNKKPEDALKLLEEVKALALSSLVLADMRANTPPSVADVKAIMAGPGGMAELDAMIDTLEPDAQRAVLRVAFEARFGVKLDNFTGANNTGGTGVIADGAQDGPNIKKFYQLLADLPSQDVIKNDSMRKFSIVETSGGASFYSGVTKDVVMREGDAVLSGAVKMGEEHEVGKPDPGCEPADNKEVTFFNWNTSHEVGHALDDKHGFMDKNKGQPAYGGWTAHVRNLKPIADAVSAHFKYDPVYTAEYLAHNANPAIPALPTGAAAVEPEEWERRRVAVRAWVDMAGVGNSPWASMSVATRLAINGVVYHESYLNSWSSYNLAARSQGITGYQFRAPGEWFSELYAAFQAKKLKPAHPAYGWLSAL
jgi:hypothetical protein